MGSGRGGRSPNRVPAPRPRLLVDALEQRRLLSGDLTYHLAANPALTVSEMAAHLDPSRITGVNVITHSFQPESISDGDALLGLGKAIVNFERYQDGALPHPSDTAWLLDYDVVREANPGVFDLNQSSPDLPDLANAQLTSTGELVLMYHWAVDSNEHAPVWTQAAGDGLFALLTSLKLVDADHPEASKPLHFITHSFGAGVTSEAVERLAYYCIAVQ